MLVRACQQVGAAALGRLGCIGLAGIVSDLDWAFIGAPITGLLAMRFLLGGRI